MGVVINGDPQVGEVVKDSIDPSVPGASLWPAGVRWATKKHLVGPSIGAHTEDMAEPTKLTVTEMTGDRALATHAGLMAERFKGDLILPPQSEHGSEGSAHEAFHSGYGQFIEVPCFTAM